PGSGGSPTCGSTPRRWLRVVVPTTRRRRSCSRSADESPGSLGVTPATADRPTSQRSGGCIEPGAEEGRSHLAVTALGAVGPIRELIVSIPAPRDDHRKHEDPAFLEEVLIDRRVVLADFLGRVGDVELDGAAAARPEVDEQRPRLRVEHVPGVGLAVKELFG